MAQLPLENALKEQHEPVILSVETKSPTTRERLKAEKKSLFFSVVSYDPRQHLKNLFRFHGTAIKMVVKGADFWLLLAWHILCSVAVYSILNETAATKTTVRFEYPYVDQSILAGAAGTLIFFVLTFYANQTYTRFTTLYVCLMTSLGAVERNLLWVRGKLYDGAFPGAAKARQDIFRYMLSAQWVAVAHMPDYKKAGLNVWVWEHLVAEKLLTASEAKELKQAEAEDVFGYKELLVWTLARCQKEVRKGHLQPSDLQDWEYNIVMKVRGQMSLIHIYTMVPIPFAYYHLVNFAVLVYLFLLGYSLTNLSPYWSILAYILVLLAMLGLRELATALSEPFGIDETDLPAVTWMLGFSTRLINRINKPAFPAEELEAAPGVEQK